MTNDSNNRAGLPQFVHDKLSSCFGDPEEAFFEDPKPTIEDIGDDEEDDDVDAERGNDLMRWRNKVAHGPLATERVEALRQGLLDLEHQGFR